MSGKRLFHSWTNPGPKHKKVSKGVILERLSTTMLLFSDSVEGLRLMGYYMLKWPGRFKLYDVNEATLTDLSERLIDLVGIND